MRLGVVSALLMACAGALTGLALARPSVEAVANAVLFTAWSAAALHASRRQARPQCRSCGAVEPARLPDGSCIHCATPLRNPLVRLPA